ncbi:MAG TPA: ABC transporter transmembrane domain-containing protein [Stellaceae bacterium]|nr:ABC transporter transmembrane domain-containing protein [Stellaceae bacterium]
MKAIPSALRLRLPGNGAAPADAATAVPPAGDSGGIQPTLHGFIIKHSIWQQVFIITLVVVSLPFYYYSLDLPKTIINTITKWTPHPFSIGIASFHLDHLTYLWTLCGLYFLMVLVNGGFKYWINRYKGQVGERMLRRLRFELYKRLLRFPTAYFKRVSTGEIIPMITSEVEPLGGFIGDIFAQPAVQGGTLLTIIYFMFMQDPILGLASLSLYPIQGYIIPKLQRKVNLLGKQRVRTIRRVADRVGESTFGVSEIHTHDNARFQLAGFAHLLGTIYDIRFEIYQRKFFVKFLNNTLNQVTPFFFFAIGGYLVIRGNLSAGALVAVLSAYKDMSAPWKELLDYYQQFQDTKIKYDQVVEQFEPEGMFDERLMLEQPETIPHFTGEMSLSNLTLVEDERVRVVDGVTTNIPLDRSTALLGPNGGGKHELALLLARLLAPTAGRIGVNGSDLATLPTAVIGRRMAYAGSTPHLFSMSLGDNLLASLKFRPLREPKYEGGRARRRAAQLSETRLSGNIDLNIEADWIDHEAAGVKDQAGLRDRLVEILRKVELDQDVYLLGLRGQLDPKAWPEAAEALLEARKAVHARLVEDKITHLVEPFDVTRYNTNASLAENLLFGTPVGPAFAMEELASNTYVQRILDKAGLTDDLVQRGLKVAETMVEIFADGAPSEEFIAQFSFISADQLPDFQAILARLGKDGVKALKKDDRIRLLSLPFKLIVSRHRLDAIDETLMTRIVEARRIFAADLPDTLRGSIEFFADDRYNAAATIQDNLLFGKLAFGEADAEKRLIEVVAQVIDALDLRRTVIEAGLAFPVGPGGSRLSTAQRQKVAIARSILKRPDVLILNEATSALDGPAQVRLIDVLKEEFAGRGLIWVLHRASLARQFQEAMVMEHGRLAEQGALGDLDKPGTKLTELMAAE